MNREFKLWFLKLLVNLPVRFFDRFLKFPSATEFPQSRMLLNVYGMMMKTYRLDCIQGVFGVVPDGNFERLLRVSAKVLSSLSESDRYYRAWLGLSYLLAEEEIKKPDLSPEELVEQIKKQWMDDLAFLPKHHFVKCQREFSEIALSSNLYDLSRLVRKDFVQ